MAAQINEKTQLALVLETSIDLPAEHLDTMKKVMQMGHNCFGTVADILDHAGGSLRHIEDAGKLSEYCVKFHEHLLSGCNENDHDEEITCLNRGDVARCISKMLQLIHKATTLGYHNQLDDDGLAKDYPKYEAFYCDKFRVGQPVDSSELPCKKACSFLIDAIAPAEKGLYVKLVRPELSSFRSEFAARSRRTAGIGCGPLR